MKLFIVGKVISFDAQSWEFDGLYSTEEGALKRCEGHDNYFIGPVTLDEELPEDVIDWIGAYYPADRR